MPTSVEQIRNEIISRIESIDQEQVALRDALRALGDDPVPAKPASRKAATRKSATTKKYTDDQIIAAVQDLGPEPALAAAVRERLPGMSSHNFSMKARRLVDKGLLQRTGERRTSAYTVVTV